MSERLTGLRTVVTGASSGMGAALLRILPTLGADVVGLDIVEPPAGSASGRHVRCDVRSEASVHEAMTEAVAHLRGLDVLVHAAGIAPFGSGEQVTVDSWNEVFAVNTLGTMLTNKAAFGYLRERGGRVINFASAAGVNGYPGKAAYAASKAAVIAWTRTVAVEWAPCGVTVNAVLPAIWTPMYERTRSQMPAEQLARHDEEMRTRIPLGGRLGDTDSDLAPVIAFLASKDSQFMTGQMFAVDGGMLMVR